MNANKPWPYRHAGLVVRTDFSDEQTWEAVGAAVREPSEEGFLANVYLVDDPAYRDLTKDQLLGLIADGEFRPSFVMIVDKVTITNSDHPILVVDMWEEPGREFRAVPRTIQGIENNLSISNMDFHEFANAVDRHGIFRGFSTP